MKLTKVKSIRLHDNKNPIHIQIYIYILQEEWIRRIGEVKLKKKSGIIRLTNCIAPSTTTTRGQSRCTIDHRRVGVLFATSDVIISSISSTSSSFQGGPEPDLTHSLLGEYFVVCNDAKLLWMFRKTIRQYFFDV